MIPLDNIWAMEPGAFRKFLHNIEAFPIPINIESIRENSKGQDAPPYDNYGGVAMVHISGPMMKGQTWWSKLFGMTSTLAVRRAVESAVNDPDIDSIMLHVDTPGGSVDGIAELGDAIFQARQQKPVIAQVDGMAASAGYYAASQASKIYAQRMDMVGSIGTRLMLYDFSKAFENEGIKAIPIDTGKFKSAGAIGTEITEEQQADFQRIVDDYFGDFRSTVRRGRGFSDEQFNSVADGRVWTAPDALGLGLIDGIQTTETTLLNMQSEAQSKMVARSNTARARVRVMKNIRPNLTI